MSLFKLGAVRLPHRKNTAGLAAVRLTPPASVLIPVSQHIGAPATPVVKPGDTVYVGTVIAEASGYVSARVHSSVSGVVKKIDSVLASSGKRIPAIRIESDGLMTPDPAIAPPILTDFESFSAAVRSSGLVGLGGAGFPTSVKLDAEKKGIINRVIINGAECEPYITSDTRTMLDDADLVKEGVELLDRFLTVDEFIIGIEKNKKDCISKMMEIFGDNDKVRVAALPSRYPQGGEKILIHNTTGLAVPEGGLPSDVGCIVMNVTTLAFIAKYVKTGMPLVEKRVTVDGSAISRPVNVIAPIGTAVSELIEFAGGCHEDIGKVLYGGPMMGIAIWNLEDPVLKNTNAITVLNKKDAEPKPLVACIHCGRCVSACPMGLNPTIYAKSMNLDDPAERAARLDNAKINLCIECGCCSYVCPSARPLVENNRMSKSWLREFRNAENAKKTDKEGK